MADRCTLHIDQLGAFTRYLAARGWVQEPCKGNYEVLRMRHPTVLLPLFVHRTDRGTEHLSTAGMSQSLSRAFIQARRAAPEKLAPLLRQFRIAIVSRNGQMINELSRQVLVEATKQGYESPMLSDMLAQAEAIAEHIGRPVDEPCEV